jgi:MscS family membrane protein
MEFATFSEYFADFGAPVRAWLERVDRQSALLAVGLVILVALFREPLAATATQGVRWVLRSLSISLSEVVEREAETFLRVLIVAGSLLVALETIAAPEIAGGFLRRILISIIVLAIFAAWYRLIEPMVDLIGPEKLTSMQLDTSWMVRLGQFVVVLMSITALLAVWKIDISSALTGVGVLGAGLAIAAQDLVRNLVAGMNNMSEKRFGTGDWIAVEGGVEGTVQRIDVRSTTIMGFDRVPRHVPNSELSNAIVLNKSRMDHRRIRWTIPLVLDATDEQVNAFCRAVCRYMRECGDYVADGSCMLVVCPVALSDNAIDILVMGYTRTRDYQPYLEACGRLVSAVRRAVREAGTDLAYPTQTIFLDGTDIGSKGA